MRAMPAGRVGMFLLRLQLDDIDAVLAETQRRLERLDEARARLIIERDAILNDLHARAEPTDFLVRIRAHDFAIEPHAQIALLLQKREELLRVRLRRNRNPEREQYA